MIHKIPENCRDERLDVYIHKNILNDLSRERIIKYIKSGLISVNGKIVKAGYSISPGDEINIIKDKETPSDTMAQDIPVDIIYEDDDIIIVNKPRGLVVHPGSGNPDKTLVNALLFHTKGTLSNVSEKSRPGVVHRIDKDTSGLLVFAKNDFSHRHLSRQFKDHTIKREYHALCEGQIEHNKIKIDRAIARSRKNREKMDVGEGGRKAVSNIRVLERYKNASYIIVELETGRTHQIRVHLKSIGHPLLGDPKYGKKYPGICGQALHAARLGLTHPTSKKHLEFFVQPPKDFSDIVDFLKRV
jgi:23S rRNA pseudouridine1911/1915/1917 synthase